MIEGGKDRPDKNHKFHLLFRKHGLGHTMAIREYFYEDDHVIDALVLYGCGSVGVKTITELDDDVLAMYCYIDIENASVTIPASIEVRRDPLATHTYRLMIGSPGSPANINHTEGFIWMLTAGESFEIVSITGTITRFDILGHKCRID
jgi:hypothetical protein